MKPAHGELSIALLIALDEGNNKEQTLKQIQQHSGLTIEEITPSYEQVAPLLKYSEIETTYADGKYPELQNHFEQQPNATDDPARQPSSAHSRELSRSTQ